MLNNLVNSLNDASDSEAQVEAKWIHVSSNKILGFREKEKSLDKEKDFLKNRLQRYQQSHNAITLSFCIERRDKWKVRREEGNRNKKACWGSKKEAVV